MSDSTPQFLRIRNWEKFQHYKNRRPPWVRYHVETLDDHELLAFSYGTQLVYARLLLLAARTDNNIPNDLRWISGQTMIDQDTTGQSVGLLLDAGFLNGADTKRAASKVIARRKQLASENDGYEPKSHTPEAEAETEAEADSSKAEVSESETPRAVTAPSFGTAPASETFKIPELRAMP